MDSNFWTAQRVLVTGATGIVGSWLVRYLVDAGAFVVVLVRDPDPQSELYRSGTINRVSVVSGALEDFQTLERAIAEYAVQVVFHLGAQTIVGTAYRSPLPTFETNVRGTWNVLEACRLHKDLDTRIVIASSDKAYGTQQQLPYTEDTTLLGRYPYEVSKSCADLIAQSYYHTYGLPVAIARCGNIYGGGDLNWSRIVPGTILAYLNRQRPIIRSDGTFIRDYIYVEDVVQAYIHLAEGLDEQAIWGHAFNFSTENPVSVLDLVAAIQGLMDCKTIDPDIRNEAVGEIHSQYLSAEKARNVLEWQPTWGLEAGLRKTINWYTSFLEATN